MRKPEKNDFNFWLMIVALFLMMLLSSCASNKTAMYCPAYGQSWDRTQNY